MANQKILDLGRDLKDDSLSIVDCWTRYKDFIEKEKIVDTAEEAYILAGLYYRYGSYLLNEGYAAKVLPLYNKAIDLIESNKGKIYQSQYANTMETLLEAKAHLAYKLDKYAEAYYAFDWLHELKPEKDDYKISRDSVFDVSVTKVVYPGYIVIVAIWLLIFLFERFLGIDIPSFVSSFCWIVWMFLLVIQFILPYAHKKIKK